MIVTFPPILPFASFKWRWASVAPTEGLNEPKVFLGVLRALLKSEGMSPGSPALLTELAAVKSETGTPVDLVRTSERNLVRNSGQYWKALGLLERSDPVIALTPFGRAVASGAITMSAFAATTIATLALPNKRVQNKDYGAWIAAGIHFKPLELILRILVKLKSYGPHEHYITKNELVRIIEPLSASAASIDDYTDTIVAHRQGKLSLSGWPDCAKDPNDHRMAAEYLIFLRHYGYCTHIQAEDAWNDKYSLALVDDAGIASILAVSVSPDLETTAKTVSLTGVPDFVERQRMMREVLVRPEQAKFRKDVLAGAGGTCAVTGVQLAAALEAAHIIPVSEHGSDAAKNGLCLRSDIHTLFDAGHIRIEPNGILHLSDAANGDAVYSVLPKLILVPPYVSIDSLVWRWKYL